jgi:hypothetical protein
MAIMSKIIAIITCILITIVISISCTKDGSGSGGGSGNLDCSTVSNKDFAATVNPIIQNSCNIISCHASGSFNGPGAITNYNEVFANRTAIRSAVASGQMPKSGSLTTAQKNSILCWIDSGAPNN